MDGLGEEVIRTWVGRGGIVGGVELARTAHPSLLAAAERFRSGAVVDQASAPTVGLVAVRQRADEQEVSIQQFAGPWPESLDPSGLLSRLAEGVVAQVASRSGGCAPA